MPKASKYVRPEEISNFAGVTVRRIQQLTQEGVIKSEKPPQGGKGRVYEFIPTVRALLLYYRSKADKKTQGNASLEGEKLLKLAASRELEEIKLQTAKGEVHHTDDIEAVFGAMVTRLRSGLMSLPLGVAPLLVNQSDQMAVAVILEKRLYRCLEEISKFNFEDFLAEHGGYADGWETGTDEEDAQAVSADKE